MSFEERLVAFKDRILGRIFTERFWQKVERRAQEDENCQILRRELDLIAKEYEAMSYEELLQPAEVLSREKVIDEATLYFSAEAFDVDKNGDIHFCIDAIGLPTKSLWKPGYVFKKRKDGSVYY